MVYPRLNATDLFFSHLKKSVPSQREEISRDFARVGSGALLRSRVSQWVDGAGALCLPPAIARRPACSVTRFRLCRGSRSHSNEPIFIIG